MRSMTGSIIARVIAFLSLLMVSRLYGPEDFGPWAIVVAVSGFLVPLATLRLELALVLPRSSRDASLVAIAAALQTIGIGIVTSLIVLVSGEPLRIWLHLPSTIVVWSIPLVHTVQALQAVAHGWLVRARRFLAIGVFEVVGAATLPMVALMMALLRRADAESYIWAGISGYTAIALCSLVTAASCGFLKGVSVGSGLRIWSMIRRYRVYPLYMTPYSLSSGSVEGVFRILLASTSLPSIVGAYGAAYSLTYIPVTVFTLPLRQVLFSYASRDQGLQEVQRVVLQMLLSMAPIIPMGIAFMGVFGTDLVAWYLGENWRVAGIFAVWLMAAAGMLMFTAWLDRLYDVLGKQRLAVALQVVSDLVILIAVVLSFLLGASATQSVAVLATAIGLYNLIWLAITLNLAGLGPGLAIRVMGRMAASGIASAAALIFLTSALPWPVAALTAGTIIVLIAGWYGRNFLGREEHG
jgi:lipopolysaccharide exporter